MITANDLKTKGVAAIAANLNEREEVSITVRGKVKYIAMTVDQYDRLRESELDMTLLEVKSDIERGNYHTSLEEHFSDLDRALKVAEDAPDYPEQ